MATIYDARSVNPDTVTDADIAAVFAEHNTTLVADGIPDFFQACVTYRRRDLFRCVAVGTGYSDGGFPLALGFMPVNLGDERTWEVMFLTGYDWERGWTAVPKEES